MPKRFRYRLEALLAHRKNIENDRAGDLARAIQGRLQAEEMLRQAQRDGVEALKRQAELQRSGQFSAQDLEEFLRYRDFLAQTELQRAKGVKEANEAEEAARTRLVAARKDREILDQLKQRQYLEWQRELDVAEARSIDELATQAYARKDDVHADEGFSSP